jgi:predicted DCC family thiol-disulfide oxidoreductase YuxK
MAGNPVKGPIIFFDGECIFCNRSVSVLAWLDKKNILKFAPLQGTTAAGVLPTSVIQSLKGVVFWNGDQTRIGSDAVIASLYAVGGVGPLLATSIRIFPRPLRELVYGWIGKIRRKIFGSQVCALPELGQARFLP